MTPKKIVALALAMVLLLVVVGACSSTVSCTTRESHDWQFVQAVGGIAVGTPHRNEEGDVILPIDCDVSGLRAITVRPTTMNSARACVLPSVAVRSQAIFITVRTELAQEGGSSRCPDANLGKLAAGRYSLFYASPDGGEQPLGSIEVPGQ